MSIISSNTLFHFTNTAENIINIIKRGFAPRFCLEEFGPEMLFLESIEKMETAVPMSCFCDLPLSKIDSHLEFYGSYGIGLSKDWGKRNGLTPITYIHDNSTQIKYLRQVGLVIHHAMKGTDFSQIPYENNPLIAIFELSGFMKSYEGKMWRINKYVDKRFYDEREWRYIPFISGKDLQYRLFKDEFLNDIKRASANERIAETFALKFDYSDIKYIIVKNENEIIPLSDAIDLMTDLFSPQEQKVLKSKIISSEQIQEDF